MGWESTKTLFVTPTKEQNRVNYGLIQSFEWENSIRINLTKQKEKLKLVKDQLKNEY